MQHIYFIIIIYFLLKKTFAKITKFQYSQYSIENIVFFNWLRVQRWTVIDF